MERQVGMIFYKNSTFVHNVENISTVHIKERYNSLLNQMYNMYSILYC